MNSTTMKSLVLSAFIYALAGNNIAFSAPIAQTPIPAHTITAVQPSEIAAFKEQLTFHQRKIDILWHQYELGLARIASSAGSHAHLDQEEALLTAGFRNDIAQGIRVADGEQSIARIAARYDRKHARRTAWEKEEASRLQQLLCAKLKEEKKLFELSKKKYADAINEQTQPLLQQVEQHMAQLIARANRLNDTASA